MIEKESPEPSTLWTLLGASLTLILLNSAFSWKSKQIIKQRDGNKSAVSGKTGLLHAAHIDHDKSKTKYDDPSNGRLLTVEEHLNDHINRAGRNGLSESANNWAITQLMRLLGSTSEEEVD